MDVALAANAQTGEFSILIAALQAADPAIIQTLSGKGQFTVFASTMQPLSRLRFILKLLAQKYSKVKLL